MAIVLRSDAPKDGATAISSALEDLAAFPPGDPLMGGAILDLSEAIAVYMLGLKDISADPSTIDKAQLTGWRYLMEKADAADTAYADVRKTDNASRFVSLSKNENATALVAAAHLAQKVAESLEGDVEFRIIEVPAVKLSAVWLAGETNIFIPYIDGMAKSKIRNRKISAEKFIKEINDRAKYVRE